MFVDTWAVKSADHSCIYQKTTITVRDTPCMIVCIRSNYMSTNYYTFRQGCTARQYVLIACKPSVSPVWSIENTHSCKKHSLINCSVHINCSLFLLFTVTNILVTHQRPFRNCVIRRTISKWNWQTRLNSKINRGRIKIITHNPPKSHTLSSYYSIMDNPVRIK